MQVCLLILQQFKKNKIEKESIKKRDYSIMFRRIGEKTEEEKKREKRRGKCIERTIQWIVLLGTLTVAIIALFLPNYGGRFECFA